MVECSNSGAESVWVRPGFGRRSGEESRASTARPRIYGSRGHSRRFLPDRPSRPCSPRPRIHGRNW